MSRAKQRANRKIKAHEISLGIHEEPIDKRNFYGIQDPTPYEAVKNIIRKERKAAACA